MKGLTRERPHTYDEAHPRRLTRQIHITRGALLHARHRRATVKKSFDFFDFFWLKRNDAENRRTPHRRSDMPKWKTRSPGCTLPQNKLDTIMEFLGFPAVGGVFLLYPAPFGAGAPVQW